MFVVFEALLDPFEPQRGRVLNPGSEVKGLCISRCHIVGQEVLEGWAAPQAMKVLKGHRQKLPDFPVL